MKYKIMTTLTCVALIMPQLVSAEMLSIKGNNVNLRSGPARSTATHWEYDNGVPMQVVKKKGDWIQVTDFEGDTGWVHKKLLCESPHFIVTANKRNRSQSINIRQKPSTSAPIVAQAKYGVVFETLTTKDGWTQVRHSEGVEGWVSNSLIWGF